MRTWAKDKGFERFLPAHFEKFLSSVKANGRRYVDWDEALMNCIRDDWGDVRRKVLREPGAVSASSVVMKKCKFCPKTAVGNVNGIDHCYAPACSDRAMFGTVPA